MRGILSTALLLLLTTVLPTVAYSKSMKDCEYTGIKASISRSLNNEKYWNDRIEGYSKLRDDFSNMYRSERLEIDKLKMTRQIRLKQARLDSIGMSPKEAVEMEMEYIRQEYEDSVSFLKQLHKTIEHANACIDIAKKELRKAAKN